MRRLNIVEELHAIYKTISESYIKLTKN